MGTEPPGSGKGSRPSSVVLSPSPAVVTFLRGGWRHARLDGVKCDAAAGFLLSRIRQVPDVAAHLV